LHPVSGILLAWLVLAENISLIFLLASSMIMVGVILAFLAR
jgi:drug/metabolite transporter (DMT)-like permease